MKASCAKVGVVGPIDSKVEAHSMPNTVLAFMALSSFYRCSVAFSVDPVLAFGTRRTAGLLPHSRLSHRATPAGGVKPLNGARPHSSLEGMTPDEPMRRPDPDGRTLRDCQPDMIQE